MVDSRTITNRRSSTHRKKSWAAFAVVVLATLALTLAYESYAQGTFLACSFLLACCCAAFAIFHQPADTMNPAKVFTLLYAASFAYAPIWLLDKRVIKTTYFGNEIADTMDRTAVICLVGYVFFLTGYFLFLILARKPKISNVITPKEKATALNLSLLTGFAATAFYLALLGKVGGVSALLAYSGGRADLLNDVYGGLFWGIHLFFASYGFLLISKMRSQPWPCLLVGLIISGIFVPFHGRDLIIAPIFCWMLAYHALHKKVSWKAVMIGASLIISLSGLVAAFRTGGNLLAMKDPMAFFTEFSERFTLYFSGVVEENVEQFDSAMIAVRYVAKEQVVLGPFVLTSWMEPLDRALFGGVIPSIYSGIFLDLLVMPEHKGWHTAVSPSIVGELWLALGWLGISLGMMILGYGFGLMARWAANYAENPIFFAAYPFVVYMLTKLVVDGSTHLFRAFLILSVTYFLSLLVTRKKVSVMTKKRYA